MPGSAATTALGILADDGDGRGDVRCRSAVRLPGAPSAARDRRRPAHRADLAGARPAPDAPRRARPARPGRPGARLPLARLHARTWSSCARRLGVVQWISLGAIPAAVPHTRPVPIIGTEAAPGLLRGDVMAGPAGTLRVPSALVSALELEIAGAGIPALGYFAQVPHYVSGPYATAALELLRALGTHLGAEIPARELAEESRELRTRLDTAAGARRDDARLRRAPRGDVRRATAAVRRRPHLRHRALPARPGRHDPRRGGRAAGGGVRAGRFTTPRRSSASRRTTVSVSSTDRRGGRFAGSAAARHPAGGSTRRRSMVSMSGGPFAMTRP